MSMGVDAGSKAAGRRRPRAHRPRRRHRRHLHDAQPDPERRRADRRPHRGQRRRPRSTSTPPAPASATASAWPRDMVRVGHRAARAGDRRGEALRLAGLDDRSTCIIFADGAGAAVVGPAADRGRRSASARWPGAARATSSSDDPIIDETDALRQEGQAVFRWATTKIAPVALRAVELAGLTPADIDVLVPHQANLRIVEAIAKRLRQAGRPRRHASSPTTSSHSGNTSSASIPMASTTCAAPGAPGPATWCCSSASAPACRTRGRSSSCPETSYGAHRTARTANAEKHEKGSQWRQRRDPARPRRDRRGGRRHRRRRGDLREVVRRRPRHRLAVHGGDRRAGRGQVRRRRSPTTSWPSSSTVSDAVDYIAKHS